MYQIQIFVGSIQGTLFSYNFSLDDGKLNKFFNTQDHIGKLTSMHLDNTNLLATSGQDENIKIYDLDKQKCLSNIFGIKGIAKKILSTSKYFVSGHETGQVFIYGKNDFCVYHKINVFKHPIIDIDIHPSGLFLICLSSTNRFSLWNLSTCANIFHKKIQTQIESVAFFDDSNVLLVSRDCFYVFNLKTLSIDKLIQIGQRDKINDFQIFKHKDNILLVCGTEKGFIYFFDQEIFYSQQLTDQYIAKFKAYDCRVKKLNIIDNYLVTISTQGDLSIWDVQEILNIEQKFQNLTLDQFSSLTDYKIETRLVLLDCKAVFQKTEKEIKKMEQKDVKKSKKISKDKRQKKQQDVKKNKKIIKNQRKNFQSKKTKKKQLIQ